MLQRKKISIIIATVFFTLIAAVAVVFLIYRSRMNLEKSAIVDIAGDAAVSIGKVHHTATREGKIEWRLDAKTAEYAPGRQEVMFTDLTAVFYDDDNREIVLTADRGVLKKNTNDIEVTGDVLVIDEEFRLNTEKLNYANGPKVISTAEPVRIVSNAWVLEADSMSMDLNTRNARFKGKVKGSFSEMLNL